MSMNKDRESAKNGFVNTLNKIFWMDKPQQSDIIALAHHHKTPFSPS